MDWSGIITSVLASSVIASAISVILTWWKTAHEDKKRQLSEAKYLAIQIVVILEKYASDCIHRRWSDEAALEMGETSLINELPKLSRYPQEAPHWVSLNKHKPKLAERSLLFVNSIASAEAGAQFESRWEGNYVAIFDEIVVTGMEAVALAKDLRREYEMGVPSIPHVEKLEQKYRKIQTRLRE